MPDPAVQEVAALVAAQENLPANPTNRRENLAREVARLANDGHFKEGLRKHAEARDVDLGGFDRKVAGFGVDVNAVGDRTLTAEEQTYKTQIETARREITKFFDKGYDGMTGTEQTRLREMVVNQARRNSALAEQVNAVGFNEQVFAERYLRDPAFIAHLKEILNDNLEGNFDNTVLDAFDEWKTKEQLAQSATDELNEATRRRDLVRAKLETFRRDPATGAPIAGVATNAAEIDRIQNLSGTHTTEIATFKHTLTTQESRLNQLKDELSQAQRAAAMRPLADIRTDLAQARTDLQTARITYNTTPNNNTRIGVAMAQAEVQKLENDERDRLQITTNRNPADIQPEINQLVNTDIPQTQNEINTRQADLQKLEDLKKMEQELEAERARLERERGEIEGRQRSTTEEANKAKRDYESAKAVRLAAEKTFTERIKNSFGEAGNRTINDMLQEAVNHNSAALEKMKEEEKEQHAREALTSLQSRWTELPQERRRGPWWNRRTERYQPIDKLQIQNDFDTLLEQGDRELVRHILTGRINPTTNAPYTNDEITSLLDKKDFMGKIGPEAIKQLLAQRFLTGGYRREDVNIIVRSQWGPGALEAAARSNQDLSAGIRTAIEQGAFNRGSFRERFGKIATDKPWLIYSILGIPIATLRAIFGNVVDEPIQNQN